MVYYLERFGNKAIVVNAMTGKHYSDSPIPLIKAKRQKRILETYTEEKEAKDMLKAKKIELRKEVEK